MTAQPDEPDTGSYEVIHLGEASAVVVPMQDFLRLRELEQQATVAQLEDAEDLAAIRQWQEREAAGQTEYIPAAEARARLGL